MARGGAIARTDSDLLLIWLEGCLVRKYRATVQVSGLAGDSPRAVRSALDEQLRNSGISNCQVVSIEIDAPQIVPKRPAEEAPRASAAQSGTGGFLLVAAAAWAILFFYWMLTAAPE